MMSSMSPIPQEIVSLMRARRTPQTDEALQQAFGISYNTWRRINAGQAIRASVAERLIQRLGKYCDSHSAGHREE
ncbi:MAG: hypothetical protein JWM65_3746 [Sphingomonas bacterium]|nr:hypothetical protein [Sphingomonas bacterium]